MKILILYDSVTGNTAKVAERIHKTVSAAGLNSTLKKVAPDLKLDLDQFNLIFCGSPVNEWLPTASMMDFLKRKLKEHRTKGDVLPCTPLKKGKYAVCFGTFCGAHIGDDEGIPMIDWLAAFFGHIGYPVFDRMLVPGKISRQEMGEEVLKDNNLNGRFGDITNRPDEKDLFVVETYVKAILGHLREISE